MSKSDSRSSVGAEGADDLQRAHDRVNRLEGELESLRMQRDDARVRLHSLESSAQYRIGSRLAWLPSCAKRLRRKAGAVLRRAKTKASGAASGTGAHAAREMPTPFASPATVPPARVDAPDVTVVIPVYNSEQWLDDCISSVLAQGGVTLEVICINDGSTDGSRAVLQRYADADSRVTVLDQPNQGQSVGRNAGLDAAAGRYLIYLDSDDFWPEDTLASLVARADAEQLDVLMFDCFAFLDGDVADSTWQRYSTYYQRTHAYDTVRTGAQMIADMRRHRDYRPHVGMYMSRTAFVRERGARFIPGIIHQDNPYTFALLLDADRVAHLDADIYARRIRPGSTITTLHDARSVQGYFLSYVSMARSLHGREFAAETTDLICEVVYGVFDGAAKKIASLTPAQLAEVKELDGAADAQLAYQALLKFRRR